MMDAETLANIGLGWCWLSIAAGLLFARWLRSRDGGDEAILFALEHCTDRQLAKQCADDLMDGAGFDHENTEYL